MKVPYDTWGRGSGEQGGRKQSMTSLGILGRGTGTHTFSEVTQTRQLGEGQGGSSPAQLRLSPHLFAPHMRRQCLQATPCTFHRPAQKGTMHDCSPPDPFWGGLNSPTDACHTRGPAPARLHKEAEAKGCGRAHHSSFLSRFPHAPHTTAEVRVKLDLRLR